MKKFFHKLLIGVALLVVMGHTIVVHHHDEIVVVQEHDDHDSDHHHSIFSFGNLDDDFITSKVQQSFPEDTGVLIVQDLARYCYELMISYHKPEYYFKNESPPPDDHSYQLSLRGPPAT